MTFFDQRHKNDIEAWISNPKRRGYAASWHRATNSLLLTVRQKIGKEGKCHNMPLQISTFISKVEMDFFRGGWRRLVAINLIMCRQEIKRMENSE